jgi:hypothetical protein
MKNFIFSAANNSYTKMEWKFMKVTFSILWLFFFLLILNRFNFAPTPEGILKLFPDSFYFGFYPKVVVFLIGCILLYNYLVEKYMAVSLLGLSTISLFVFSLEDSNSDFNRNNMITGIFFAQFIAYSIFNKYNDFNIEKFRVQFSVQIIAICYFLSAIAKLKASGLNWVTDGLLIPLQILKTNYFVYVNTGDIQTINHAYQMIDYVNQYSLGIMFVLAFALFIEFFALFSIINKMTAFIYGILLLLMHIGMYVILNIAILGAYLPMLIFMLNPTYLIFIYVKKVKYYLSNYLFNFKIG